MQYVYYEPVENKIYFSEWHVGAYPKSLPKADDGEFVCRWYFNDPELVFYYLGELS